MRYTLMSGARAYEVEIEPDGKGAFAVTVDGVSMHFRAERRGTALDLHAADGVIRAWVTRDGERTWVTAPGLGEAQLVRRVGSRARTGTDSSGRDLTSPMPGKVVKVLVNEGDSVKKGSPLVVVEAMKTELSIVAPRDARVLKVGVKVGEMCEAGKPLLELGEPAEAD